MDMKQRRDPTQKTGNKEKDRETIWDSVYRTFFPLLEKANGVWMMCSWADNQAVAFAEDIVNPAN